MENYQLKQLKTGQYMIVVDGEVLREATAGEVRCYLLQKKFPVVEAGFLEVSLALAGVTGILSTFSSIPVVQAISVAAFFLSVLGAYNLTWLYIQPRLPLTWTRFLNSPIKQRYPNFPLTVWLCVYIIREAFRLSISSKDAEDDLLEVSYLTLFLAVLLAGVAMAGIVLMGLVKALQ